MYISRMTCDLSARSNTIIRPTGTIIAATEGLEHARRQDLRQIAIVVIGALEKWEDVQGLGG